MEQAEHTGEEYVPPDGVKDLEAAREKQENIGEENVTIGGNKDLKAISEKRKNISEEWVPSVRVKIECLDFFYIYKRVIILDMY